jgi:MerR family transcriptional regulator/heat shock protein HspR
MTRYTRRQIVELLEVEEELVLALEREEIIEAEAADAYSEQMLERVRVAANLMADLDVNLPGVAIIVRLREELSTTRRQLEELAKRLQGKG